jgi:polyisoprenoid-binding protein YceI
MTNYLSAMVLCALVGGTACAADKTPATGKPAATAVGALPHYVQTAGSTLGFTFEQAGAQSNGSFKQFATTFDYDPQNLAASKLTVKVQIGSLDTQDKDRDSTLVSADLFDAQKYPVATYAASSLVKVATGLEAVGKLTIRGITKDLRVPLTIKPAGTGLELSGTVTIKRLDFGVGQGEWKSTEWVGDPVKLTYKVLLSRSTG